MRDFCYQKVCLAVHPQLCVTHGPVSRRAPDCVPCALPPRPRHPWAPPPTHLLSRPGKSTLATSTSPSATSALLLPPPSPPSRLSPRSSATLPAPTATAGGETGRRGRRGGCCAGRSVQAIGRDQNVGSGARGGWQVADSKVRGGRLSMCGGSACPEHLYPAGCMPLHAGSRSACATSHPARSLRLGTGARRG